jgi:peptide/nickel transport system permease protein
MVPTILLVTIMVFMLIRIVPGDVITLMAERTEGGTAVEYGITADQIKEMLGLDQPIYIQYFRWLGNIIHGDLGKSLWSTRTVIDELKSRIPVSVELGILALTIGQLVAFPVGIYSAIRQDSFGDLAGRSLAIAFLCIPTFWLATLLMVYPALWWKWMPPSQYVSFFQDPLGNLAVFIWPALIMGLNSSGATMRMTRTMMLEVLRQDYIRTAWSKGLKEHIVIIRHGLRNALIPVITIVGMQIPVLIGGVVIIEQIFNLPGMGRLFLESLTTRDYTMLSGVNLFIATFVLVNNLGVDLTYGYLDPRIRYT